MFSTRGGGEERERNGEEKGKGERGKVEQTFYDPSL